MEEPVFEPEPAPLEITAEAIPLPTDFCVVVEAECHAEPRTGEEGHRMGTEM